MKHNSALASVAIPHLPTQMGNEAVNLCRFNTTLIKVVQEATGNICKGIRRIRR